MPLIDSLSKRQQTLLETLLEHRAGLNADDLARKLEISRNATLQHLAGFEKLGWIESEIGESTGGRPARRYRLSAEGHELFPRHYTVISNLLINWIRKHHDEATLSLCFEEMGAMLAQPYIPRVAQYHSLPQKISELTAIMQDLGYQAITQTNDDGASEIVAHNCIFHSLATSCDQVCKLDLSMMGSLLEAQIELHECIVKGGSCCRFGISPVSCKATSAPVLIIFFK